MLTFGSHFVKVKSPESKRFTFLTPKGGVNNLRVHAGRWAQDAAERLVAEIKEENPGWDAKAVEIK